MATYLGDGTPDGARRKSSKLPPLQVLVLVPGAPVAGIPRQRLFKGAISPLFKSDRRGGSPHRLFSASELKHSPCGQRLPGEGPTPPLWFRLPGWREPSVQAATAPSSSSSSPSWSISTFDRDSALSVRSRICRFLTWISTIECGFSCSSRHEWLRSLPVRNTGVPFRRRSAPNSASFCQATMLKKDASSCHSPSRSR